MPWKGGASDSCAHRQLWCIISHQGRRAFSGGGTGSGRIDKMLGNPAVKPLGSPTAFDCRPDRRPQAVHTPLYRQPLTTFTGFAEPDTRTASRFGPLAIGKEAQAAGSPFRQKRAGPFGRSMAVVTSRAGKTRYTVLRPCSLPRWFLMPPSTPPRQGAVITIRWYRPFRHRSPHGAGSKPRGGLEGRISSDRSTVAIPKAGAGNQNPRQHRRP